MGELSRLRALLPYRWDTFQAWPAEELEQGLPVVELRQDHLRALLDEVEECRRAGGEVVYPGRAPVVVFAEIVERARALVAAEEADREALGRVPFDPEHQRETRRAADAAFAALGETLRGS